MRYNRGYRVMLGENIGEFGGCREFRLHGNEHNATDTGARKERKMKIKCPP